MAIRQARRHWIRERTFVDLSGLSLVYTRTRLMQTSESSRVALYTSPEPPEANGLGLMIRGDESVYDEGSIVLDPHMPLSSRRHFRKVVLKGLRRSRAYAGLDGEQEWTIQ